MNTHGIPVDYCVRGDADFVLLQKFLMDKTRMKYFVVYIPTTGQNVRIPILFM